MKIITTEVLIKRQMDVPVITGIYDPLSRKYDGTVTPQAPIIVWGRHLDKLNSENLILCLASATGSDPVIEVPQVYKYAHNQVIVSLPFLTPGEYYPAVKVRKNGQEDLMYIFPVSWVVLPEWAKLEL